MNIGKPSRKNTPQQDSNTTDPTCIDDGSLEREEHFRALIECSLDAIVVLNKDGSIRYQSSSFENMLGYKTKTGTSHSFLDHVHADNLPQAKRFITELIQKPGSSQHTEMRMQHKDGSWRWIEAKGTNSLDNPVVEGIVIYARDITDRKGAQDKLKAAEENYRTLFENSAVAITVVDEDENIVSWNKYTEDLLGMDRNDLYMKPISVIYPDEEWRKMRAQNLRQKGLQHHLETKLLSKDQKIIDVDLSLSMFKGPDEKIIGTIGIIADISDRKQAQRQLKMVEANYITIFENSAIAITLADENEKIISWNKYAETLLGMNKEDLFGKPVKSLYPEAEWQMIRNQNIRQKGMHHHLETKIIKKNKDIIDVDLSISVLRGTDGKITGSIAIIADVSERKQAQEQLRQVEENYRTLFENTAVAITVTDENENIISWNRYSEILLGYDKDELYLKPVKSLYPKDEWQMIRDQDIRRKGMQNHLETKMIRKNGDIFDVDLSVSVLKGTHGEITGSIGIVTDVTDYKRTREQLKTAKEQFDTLFENSAVAVMVADENEKIVSWNKYAEAMFGMDKSELHMRPVSSLYPEEEWQRIRSEDIRQKGMQNHFETKILKSDGNVIDVDLSINVLKGANGEVNGSIGVIANISDLKKAEDEKQKMEQQLQLAGRLAAVGELAAGVAHELNNPLTAVRGYAQFLTTRKNLDEAIRGDIETIYQEAQRATKITSNLLSFARRHKPEKSLVSVNYAIEKSLELHTYRMNVNNIEVIAELDPDLPKTFADFNHLQQIFVNIITNAEQALTDYSKNGRLLVKSQVSNGMIQVSFIDNGPGISNDDIQKIFDPFFTTKDVGKGTGLGLSICYGLVKEHGGSLFAKNNNDEGTTFIVELPVVAGQTETIKT